MILCKYIIYTASGISARFSNWVLGTSLGPGIDGSVGSGSSVGACESLADVVDEVDARCGLGCRECSRTRVETRVAGCGDWTTTLDAVCGVWCLVSSLEWPYVQVGKGKCPL